MRIRPSARRRAQSGTATSIPPQHRLAAFCGAWEQIIGGSIFPRARARVRAWRREGVGPHDGHERDGVSKHPQRKCQAHIPVRKIRCASYLDGGSEWRSGGRRAVSGCDHVRRTCLLGLRPGFNKA